MKRPDFPKFWIIITAAFLLVGFFIAAWFFTLEITQKDILARYNQQQLLVASGTAISMRGFFDDLSGNLGALAMQPEIQNFDQAHIPRILVQKLDELNHQGITDIGVLDESGMGVSFAVKTEAVDVDYSWQGYFKSAASVDLGGTLNSLIIDLGTANPGDMTLTAAVPIFETAVDPSRPTPSGKFLGVIVADLSLDILAQRYLISFKPPGDGQICLVDNEFDIIWSSDPEMIMKSALSHQGGVLAPMVDQISAWTPEVSTAGFYQSPTSSDRDDLVLIAFAPVDLGLKHLAVAVITPEVVVRQTSFSNFQGQQLVFTISVLTILLAVITGGLGLGRELTRRLRVENALKKSEMEQAVTSERVRLAADLHDSVTQGLYGILLHADAAAGHLKQGHPSAVAAYLDQIKAAGKEGLAEMRSLIFELRPSVLDESGLAAALETRLYAVERRAGVTAKLNTSVAGYLPLEIETGFYRIAQEALNNALKYAQAEHIWVDLHQNKHTISLEIRDDGCGFDLGDAQSGGGMGLSNIAERVSKINGDLTIDSQIGVGTRIIVEVSL